MAKSENDTEGRRGALKALAVVSGLAVAGTVGGAGAVLVLSPPGGIGSGGRYVKTVRLESLKDGEPKKVVLIADRRDAWMIEKDAELGAVWLLRKADSVLAFSVVCPHLGCSIGTEAGGKFACPCHDSSFTPEGKKLSGPSPRDLDRLETKIEDGFVHVEFRKFRYGIPERVEIG